MKKMIKRADGSYSQRGLWDNIRANKGSGKKPTKEMLEQEKKINNESKKSNKMNTKYKKGGKKVTMKKPEKDSYMLENIELDFEKESMGMGV